MDIRKLEKEIAKAEHILELMIHAKGLLEQFQTDESIIAHTENRVERTYLLYLKHGRVKDVRDVLVYDCGERTEDGTMLTTNDISNTIRNDSIEDKLLEEYVRMLLDKATELVIKIYG